MLEGIAVTFTKVHYKLDNLCAVVDRNRLQISGCTEDVMSHENLAKRWESFGWNVIDVEKGWDIPSLNAAFEEAKQCKGKPSVIIAHTIKGYGVSFMENQAVWHHKVPTDEEYQLAMEELKAKEAAANE